MAVIVMFYMIDDGVNMLFMDFNITLSLTISCFVAYIYITYLLGKW